MDVIAVHEAARRAVIRAREGGGPTLLECLTYRFRGHSLADPDELRAPSEKEFWSERDPILRFKQHVIQSNLLSQDRIREIDQEVDQLISDAVQYALSAPEPLSEELTNYIWA